MNIKDNFFRVWHAVTGLVNIEYKIKVTHKLTSKPVLLVGSRSLFSTVNEVHQSTKAYIVSNMNDDYVVADIERIK